MSETIVEARDSTFDQEVLKSELPVLVDFWASWCGPCKMIAPVLEEVAKIYQGNLKTVKVNVDENQSTPTQYGVRGIPTLLLFKDSVVQASHVGALSKSQLISFLEPHLQPK